MRHLNKYIATLLATLLLTVSLVAAREKQPSPADKLTPAKIGEFSALAAVTIPPAPFGESRFDPRDYHVQALAARTYTGPNGERLFVHVFKTTSPAAAYSLLQTEAAAAGVSTVRQIEGLGLLGFEVGGRIMSFARGGTLVRIGGVDAQAFNRQSALALARAFAEKIEGDAGFIPILVLHLPEWDQKISEGVGYAVTLPALQQSAGQRPVFDVVSFEGGAEAVTAGYGDARLVIVEFTTPQHSVENDARINERIEQLRAAGQAVPSFYQRVGNYSVFVFDAPDEAAARSLASGVKYEKDVRWLGRNPREGELIERYYTQTMGGAFIAALITTGVAILVSLGVGGLIGGAVFFYRRTRPGAQEAYSDAGGMMRLNLEDFDPAGGTEKMLGPKQD